MSSAFDDPDVDAILDFIRHYRPTVPDTKSPVTIQDPLKPQN